MLIDCFLGFDEVKLAEFRVVYLKDVVNQTLILESRKTFSGDAKPLHFSDWKQTLPDDLKQKIEIVELNDSDLTSDSAWDRDIFSRESLNKIAIEKYPGSRFIFSDLDEIPAVEQVEKFLISQGNYHFKCRTIYRKANLFVMGRHDNWNYGVFSSSPELLVKNGGRFQRLPLITSNDFGIHFSYLGMSPRRIKSKLNSFAHTEYRGLSISFDHYLAFCDKYIIDHLGRIRSETYGLLKYQSTSECTSSILNSLFEFEPSWFYPEFFKQNLLKRLIASGMASFGMRVSKQGEITPIRKFIFSRFFSEKPSPGFSPIHALVRLILISGAIIEIFLAVLWNLRRYAKKFATHGYT